MCKIANLGKIGKKKIIISVIIVLILAAGGFFCWQKDKIESFLEQKELKKMVALSEDYTLVEDIEKRFIINEKDGLKIKVPAEWKAEIGTDMFGSPSKQHVTLYSQDFSYRPSKGCLIEMQISRLQNRRIEEYNGDFEIFPYEGVKEVKEIINFYKEAEPEEKEKMQGKGIEVISVDQKEVLKETVVLEGDIGKHVSLKIPTENKVYIFECILFSEECNEELNQFLETISID